MRLGSLLHGFALVWLILAGAMAASHDLSHQDEGAGVEVECALCHIGTDDDLLLPELPRAVVLAQTGEVTRTALRHHQPAPVGLHSIRGPPAAQRSSR
jgi:hypothetical protein